MTVGADPATPGNDAGVVLDAEPDETRHTAALSLATRTEQGGGDSMDIYRP
jgi:hypothetical protein